MSASSIILRIMEFQLLGPFAFLIPAPPGLNSVVNITDSLNENITNLVINSIQVASTNLFQNQTLNVDCKEWQKLTAEGKIECAKDFNGTVTAEKAVELCNIFWGGSCGANEVTMKGVMQVNINDDMKIKIKNNISSNMKTTINTTASKKDSGGIAGMGNTVTNKVSSDIENITDILQNYIQYDYNTIIASQTINLKNGTVSLITQDVFANSFKNFTANNNSYTTSIDNIASAIKVSSDQDLGMFGGNIIITIVAVIIGILVIIGIILWILKNRKKHN